MNYEQEIQNIIKDSIKSIKEQRQEVLKQQQKSFDNLDIIVNKIERVLADEKELANISEEELDSINTFFSEDDKNVLNAYRIFLKSQYLVFDKKFSLKLKSICVEVIEKYNLYKRTSQENDQMIELMNYQKQLEKLQTKIIDYKITSEDLDLFALVFKEAGLPISKQIELLIFISNQHMTNINIDELYEEVSLVPVQGIDEEQLIQLFSKYGYDFNELNSKSREKFQKEGNLENIAAIFGIFAKYNIDLNEIVNGVSVLKCRSTQLSEIFIHSNATLIENLIMSVEKANLMVHGKFQLLDLLKTPSVFISRTIPYKLKTPEKDDGPDYKINTYGCNQDFIANLELLRQKYDDVASLYPDSIDSFYKIYEKCSSMLKKPNMQILNAMRIYDLYNISPEEYLNALSGLNSINQADVFDIAIELDCFEYIKQNMSRAMLNINDRRFNNIALARVKGYGDERIFKTVERHTLFTTKSGLQIRDSYLEKSFDGMEFYKFSLYDNDRFDKQDQLLFDKIEKILDGSNNFDISLSMSELNDSESKSFLKKLEKYVSTDNPMVYLIYGIRISKLKVLRFYNTLKQHNININVNILIYILTKNSYLNQYQFNTICDEIEELFQKEKGI